MGPGAETCMCVFCYVACPFSLFSHALWFLCAGKRLYILFLKISVVCGQAALLLRSGCCCPPRGLTARSGRAPFSPLVCRVQCRRLAGCSFVGSLDGPWVQFSHLLLLKNVRAVLGRLHFHRCFRINYLVKFQENLLGFWLRLHLMHRFQCEEDG